MEYTKIRISSKDAPDRLYRIFLIRDDLPLTIFAEVIMSSFLMSGEHIYEFRNKNRRFVLTCEDCDKECVPMPDYRISDLSEQSVFIYDLGEWWEFEVRKYKRKETSPLDQPVILQEGKGAGIFEDDRKVYLSYIAGNVDPKSRNTDPSRGAVLPWNLELLKFGEFEWPLDLEIYQEEINEIFEGMNEDWYRFDHLMESAYEQWENGEGISLYLLAFEEFRKVCAKLKEENRLPESADEFIKDESVPDSACDVFMDLLGTLRAEREFEKLYEILNQLKEIFVMNGLPGNLWNYHMFYDLLGLQKTQQAYSSAEEWMKREPENPFAVSVMIETLSDQKRFQEAEELIDKFTSEGSEYDIKNSVIFATAIVYHRRHGNVRKAQELTARIEKAENEEEEFMEELVDPDMDYNYLTEAVEDYELDPGDYTYLKVGEAFCLALVDDLMIYPEVDYADENDIAFCLIEIEGNQFLGIYTSLDAADRLSYEPKVQIPLRYICEMAEDMGVSGIMFDPDFENEPCIIPVELCRETLDTLKRYGEIEEDDDQPSSGLLS